MPAGIKPDFKKLNPLTGAKNLFGPNAIAETLKSVAKVSAVGGIVALAVFPKLQELAGARRHARRRAAAAPRQGGAARSPSAPRSPTS